MRPYVAKIARLVIFLGISLSIFLSGYSEYQHTRSEDQRNATATAVVHSADATATALVGSANQISYGYDETRWQALAEVNTMIQNPYQSTDSEPSWHTVLQDSWQIAQSAGSTQPFDLYQAQQNLYAITAARVAFDE